MTLLLIGLLGGFITGISPCILPVLPVIFLSGGVQSARPEFSKDPVNALREKVGAGIPSAVARRAATATLPQPDLPDEPQLIPRSSGLRPYLVILGLVLSFSVFTLFGTLIIQALHLPDDLIRWIGLIVLVLLGIGLIVPRFESILEKPFSWIPQRAVGTDRGGFVLGIVLGAVYVPCAGPVLAAITVAGATGRIGLQTVALTLSFAIGTAIPLLFFALAGRRVGERLRSFRKHQRVIRTVSGVVMIALAVALTFNLTDAIQRAIPDYTAAVNSFIEHTTPQGLAAGAGVAGALASCQASASENLQNCGAAPAFTGIQSWQNTPSDTPLTLKGLRGKVVLVDFWAYSCINCQREIAHVDAWYSAYRDLGFEVVGVHTPEYAFEHDPANVASGAKRLGIQYPIAIDNDYGTWNAYGNNSWPAAYLVDAKGNVRHVAIGEGNYGGEESLIRQLITKARPGVTLPKATDVPDTSPTNPSQTPETYLGTQRAEGYAGPTSYADGTRTFAMPKTVPQDRYGLGGTWTLAGESITAKGGSSITLHYDASKVYLDVGGSGTLTVTQGSTPSATSATTFKVSGAPDIYTVVSSSSPKRGTVTIQLSPRLAAYSFTFG
ncbi:cytochrome c biogenesis protein DipZ [Humibacter sp. RRB41]|uniref:cytochrome c biogenesis protein DipZ n=1 Tax=Humibacter sp. RRB41 TaxID=2919946 RepID=UPI001FAB1FB9|nr:cytochrome c biogenesis protein DipZ [Humibacter sp. RRB41]